MELLHCPFCGAGTTRVVMNGQTWTGTKYSDPISVSVVHHCDPIEGQPSRQIERIGRDAESAIAAWNRRASPASVPVAAPDYRIADRGFRWDAETRQHIPQLLIEFAPVPANEPNDSKGWKDRDSLAAMLAAAPTPASIRGSEDSERFREGWTHACNALCMEIALWIERCPHCGMPAPKAPATQEDKP